MPEPTPEEIEHVLTPHFDKVLRDGHAPGAVFGVLYDGKLIVSGGLGESSLGSSAPDADTVFRIASMTKSFTAATVLSLRDAGRLSLDDPASTYVAELRGGDNNAKSLTIRHLLTMSAGFPTDDPWGDRQQDLPHEAFRALLARPVSPSWRPGELFEYSNLGYAIVGLVVEAVTSGSYDGAVREHVLEPLGMSSSTFHLTDLADGRLATGYVKRSTGWDVEPVAGYGAFAPMGGLLSSVNDLGKWVVALMQAADADADAEPAGLAPMASASSLREMQRTQRLVAATATADGGGTGAPEVAGYGYGLFEEFREWGRSVFHSGGYPGYGSHMRWHPASGLGVIGLANGTYAPMYSAVQSALEALVRTFDVPHYAPPMSVRGLERAEALVRAWLAAETANGDESDAMRALFADNVERDVPWAEREVQWGNARSSYGVHEPVPGSRKQLSPAVASWRIRPPDGAAPVGELEVMVMMSPISTEQIQSITIKAIPAPQRPSMPATRWI